MRKPVEKPKPSHTIHKFAIPTRGRVKIEMPRFAKILCVHVQEDGPVLYAEVDTVSLYPKEDRHFEIRLTGCKPYVPFGRYIGTFQMNAYVGHVYELEPK